MIFAENAKEFLSWALFICFWMNAGSHEATHLLSAVSCRGRAECWVRDTGTKYAEIIYSVSRARSLLTLPCRNVEN